MKKKILVISMILFFALMMNCHAETNDTQIRIEYMDRVYTNLNIFGKQFSNKQGVVYANGTVAYCIEPGIYILSDLYDSVPYFDVANITTEMKEQMELYAYYGYQYEGHQTANYYLATQQLIWETLGMTDILFTTGLNRTGQVILVENEKREILQLIEKHEKKPSFDGTVIEGESGEILTIEDQNQVLSAYQLTEADPVVQLDGNTLLLYPFEVGEKTITLEKKLPLSTSMVYRKENSQTLATFGLSKKVTASFSLKTKGYQIEVDKKDAKTKGEAPKGRSLEGAEYEITTVSGDVVDRITTDEHGYALSKELPAGTYKVKEKVAPYGYLMDDRYHVVGLGKTIPLETIVVYEIPYEVTVELQKYLEEVETSILIPEANVTFEITNQESGEKRIVSTDESGRIVLSLTVGTYLVQQKTTTENYQKVDDFMITIDEENDEVLSYELIDRPEKGKIEIQKVGESEEGEVPLSSVEFSLYRMNGEEQTWMDTKTTGEDGKLEFVDLPFGNYCLIETKTQEGYQLEEEPYCFFLEGKETKQLTIKNELYQTELEFTKVGEEMVEIKEGQVLYQEVPLANVSFDLYQEGVKDKITTIRSDESGVIHFKKHLKPGTYYFVEQTKEAYRENETKYYFIVDEQYQTQVQFESKIQNYLKKGSVTLLKKDENDLPLNDTTFALYTESKEKLMECKTDERGVIEVSDLPVGSYYFLETKAKEGYVKQEKKISFEIHDDEEQITLKTVNHKEVYPNTENYISKTKTWLIGLTLAGSLLFFFGILLERKK